MKKLYTLFALMACLIMLNGCATTGGGSSGGDSSSGATSDVKKWESTAQFSAAGACTVVMALSHGDDADKLAKAKIMESVAQPFMNWTGDRSLTPEEVGTLVRNFVPDKKHWSEFCANIANMAYGLAYPHIKDSAADAKIIINAIGRGIHSVSGPYIK